MTLIVEDGTSLVDAESYASVSEADTYFSKRGITIWTNLTTPEKEQALVRATDFMGYSYTERWDGYKAHASQALDWPRRDIIAKNDPFRIIQVSEVPKEVKTACIELALRASMGPLLEDLTRDVISETAGPVKVTYSEFSSQVTKYLQIVKILNIFFKAGSGGNMLKLRRV